MTALVFVLVTVAFAAGLMVNHLVGLRDRVEVNASEIRHQKNRVARIEASIANAEAGEKLLLEQELQSVRDHIARTELLHSKVLGSYQGVSKSLPSALVRSVAALPATAQI